MIQVIPNGENPHRTTEATRRAFDAFVAEVEPRLRRALIGAVGIDRAADAVAEALAWAWQNWSRVEALANPAGYLYRVARSAVRIRPPKRVRYLPDRQATIPHVEPGLIAALASLPERQRTVVWLVYACEWRYGEVAEALNISSSAVGTHASRALASLRASLGEPQ